MAQLVMGDPGGLAVGGDCCCEVPDCHPCEEAAPVSWTFDFNGNAVVITGGVQTGGTYDGCCFWEMPVRNPTTDTCRDFGGGMVFWYLDSPCHQPRAGSIDGDKWSLYIGTGADVLSYELDAASWDCMGQNIMLKVNDDMASVHPLCPYPETITIEPL